MEASTATRGRGRPRQNAVDPEVDRIKAIKDKIANGEFSDEGEDATLVTVINDATRLIEEKSRLLADLQEARILANLLVNRGAGSEAQREWVGVYLPRKKRREADEDDATAGLEDE